jgi:3-hydroxybutyryl-CoA dehydrogenase
MELPGGGAIGLTRGRTATEETARSDRPVVVLDRCLEPDTVTALAYAVPDTIQNNEQRTAEQEAVALLFAAGIGAYRIADVPGLITARVVAMLINEATSGLAEQIASAEDIDTAMQLGTNYPLGPLRWCDRWSPSVVLELLDALHREYLDPRYRASQKLRAAARTAESFLQHQPSH